MRIRSLDLARGFTVLMIAPIHTMLLYSEPSVQQTLLGNIFKCIAEGPGAQLFMTLMGVTFTFSKRPGEEICKRFFLLLAAAYVLNIFKFIFPLLLGFMPAGFKDVLPHGLLPIFLIGDILHFAAFALPVLFLLHKFKDFPVVPLMTAAVVLLISPILWDLESNNFFTNYILQLAGGAPPQVYFPFFPWLVYPLTGLTIGYYLKDNPQKLFSDLKYIGSFLVIAGYLLDDGRTTSFYRTYPPSTLMHIGIVLLTLYVWNLYNKYIKQNNFSRLLEFMSRNITTVYIIQWILIIWMLPFFGYQKLNFFCSVIAILFTTSCTLFITVSINFYRNGK